MQSGLSWRIILGKRASFRKAFDNFDAKKIAGYSKSDVMRLLADTGIIRNKRKIDSAINNAKRFLEIKKEFGTFDRYVWSFVNYNTIHGRFKTWDDIPATSTRIRTDECRYEKTRIHLCRTYRDLCVHADRSEW